MRVIFRKKGEKPTEVLFPHSIMTRKKRGGKLNKGKNEGDFTQKGGKTNTSPVPTLNNDRKKKQKMESAHIRKRDRNKKRGIIYLCVLHIKPFFLSTRRHPALPTSVRADFSILL